jgi:LysR family transcriptional regulator, glycine cleavage system transcriptional activator
MQIPWIVHNVMALHVGKMQLTRGSVSMKSAVATYRERPITLAGLRGFEAAARHMSLTRAAQELNLTQSAISRQVQGLEEELGVSLFARKAREIVLTPAGREWLPQLQTLLRQLDTSVERLRREANSPRVTISTFASFASLWLIPRLGDFRALRPNVDIDLGATDRIVDLESEDVDLAIRYLAHENAPPEAELLFEETLFPLVSPTYMKSSKRLTCLDDLNQHTLIEAKAGGLAEVRSQWSEFFASLGLKHIKGAGEIRFDFIAQTMMAAERGQGVALGRTYGGDLYMKGELVRPFDVAVSTGAGCFLIVSPRVSERPEAKLFAEWVRTEAQKFNRELSRWFSRTKHGSSATPTKRATKKRGKIR